MPIAVMPVRKKWKKLMKWDFPMENTEPGKS